MAEVNYKPLVLDKIEALIDKCPEFTISQIVMCMYRYQSGKRKISNMSDLLDMTDAEAYAALDRALTEEEQEEPLTPEDIERVESESKNQ